MKNGLVLWAEEAARRGELQVGDILVQAEDQKITASSVYEVASVLLGPPGEWGQRDWHLESVQLTLLLGFRRYIRANQGEAR